jgi:three-Cys-motif partner protein
MPSKAMKDSNPEYWTRYSNLQYVKHQLMKEYLNGWIPKLGRYSGRICYIDTHAGKGRHKGGQKGSPLVALESFLNHKYRDRLLEKCEVSCTFIEGDPHNFHSLESEIESMQPLPKQISVSVLSKNCFEVLQELIDSMNNAGSQMAPAFIFVDPYGFRVPGKILHDLMTFDRVELFVNIIWRELSMGIKNGAESEGMAETLDLIFEGDGWRKLTGLPFNEQADACINLFRSNIGAKWSTHIKMLGKNSATRYMLMHLTNHDAGRDLMKDCIWKACPEGGYLARISDNPKQQFLIEPKPDLKPLQEWVLQHLLNGPVRWQDLIAMLRQEIWREPQLNQIIRGLRKAKAIDGRDYENRFVPSQNPELYLV